MTAAEAAPPRRHLPVRADWLSLRAEPAIEPDLPVIDPHHHLWDKPGGRYLLPDLLDDLGGGHDIRATVFVECHSMYRDTGPAELRSLGETEFAAGVAAMSASGGYGPARVAAGIVGNVDLRLGDRVDAVLDSHEAASGGRFRGVRNGAAWHADPAARGSILTPPEGLLRDSGFRAGVARLAARGLVFDAWIYHTQLDELAELVRLRPEATFVLNHVGGPIGIGPYAGRRDEVFSVWREGLHALARFDNVHVKIGGFGMRLFGFGFQERPLPPSSDALAAAWGPYIEETIAAFGPSRCMFESNFPVDKGTCALTVLWNAFKKASAAHSPDERHALFFGTAARVYALDVGAA